MDPLLIWSYPACCRQMLSSTVCTSIVWSFIMCAPWFLVNDFVCMALPCSPYPNVFTYPPLPPVRLIPQGWSIWSSIWYSAIVGLYHRDLIVAYLMFSLLQIFPGCGEAKPILQSVVWQTVQLFIGNVTAPTCKTFTNLLEVYLFSLCLSHLREEECP